MPIRGLTHDQDGNVRVARTVTVKLAIGLPPAGPKDHPKRLDHFIFLRKELEGKEVRWTEDPALTEHYKQQAAGDPVREVWITFLDDDPEKVFRTEYAAWMARGKWCSGDGKTAQRRDTTNGAWGQLQPYNGPCENGGCPEVDKGACGPGGDLYFMLNDFPALGTICRIHTGSYESIRQISSALQDLGRITGGRLTGVSAKLFLSPDRNQYTNGQGARVTGAPKWVLGLELAAADLPKLQERMLQTSMAFQQIRGRLASGPIEEDDAERGREIAAEFQPGSAVAREQELRDVAVRMMRERWNLDDARLEYCLKQYEGRMAELIERMENTTRKNQEDKHDGDRREPGAEAERPEQRGPEGNIAGTAGAGGALRPTETGENLPADGARDGAAGGHGAGTSGGTGDPAPSGTVETEPGGQEDPEATAAALRGCRGCGDGFKAPSDIVFTTAEDPAHVLDAWHEPCLDKVLKPAEEDPSFITEDDQNFATRSPRGLFP